MPKISLSDQLDNIKNKFGSMFSRKKKPAAEMATDGTAAAKQGQLKRVAPLVVVAALIGVGYTYQNDIMALVMPPTPANQPAPLEVVRAETPAPTPVAATPEAAPAEMVAEMTEEAVETAAAEPAKIVSETTASEELDLIDRKLAALRELEAMEDSVSETSELPVAALQEESSNDEMPLAAMEMEMGMESDLSHNPPPAAETIAAARHDLEAVAEELETMEVSMSGGATAESMAANQWTMWQSSNQWAVQLMAVKTKAYLIEFIEKNGLQEGATWFEFDRNGDHFYALVVGVYNTRIAADKAALALSDEYGIQPWVRSMRSIHNVISYDFSVEEPTLALNRFGGMK